MNPRADQRPCGAGRIAIDHHDSIERYPPFRLGFEQPPDIARVNLWAADDNDRGNPQGIVSSGRAYFFASSIFWTRPLKSPAMVRPRSVSLATHSVLARMNGLKSLRSCSR